VKYLVDLTKVITKHDLGIIGQKGDKFDADFIKQQVVEANPELKGNEDFIEVTLGVNGTATVLAKNYKGKTLYQGSVNITYKMRGDSVLSDVDMTKYPLAHQPSTDQGKELGETLKEHNPNFNPND